MERRGEEKRGGRNAERRGPGAGMDIRPSWGRAQTLYCTDPGSDRQQDACGPGGGVCGRCGSLSPRSLNM